MRVSTCLPGTVCIQYHFQIYNTISRSTLAKKLGKIYLFISSVHVLYNVHQEMYNNQNIKIYFLKNMCTFGTCAHRNDHIHSRFYYVVTSPISVFAVSGKRRITGTLSNTDANVKTYTQPWFPITSWRGR